MGMATVALALALLALAALLAGLGATVRALSGVDGKARPTILSVGVGVGVLGAGIAVAPEILGPQTFTIDASTLTILAGAVLVAAADVVEAVLGLRLVLLAVPARAALREGEAAMATGDGARAATAYARAVDPLVRGKRRQAELDARLKLTEALVAAGDLNGAAIKLHEALTSAREQGDPEVTWATLLRAVLIDSDLDRLSMANRHLGEAATVARELLSQSHLANVFAELAWVAYLAGDLELAGTCIGWAGRAAGRIDASSAFAASTTLLAAHLALASGDLVSADSALTAVAEAGPAIADPDLDAGVELGRVCLAYLGGLRDSARDSLRAAVPGLHRARWRSRLVLPLVSLTLEARRQERTDDMAIFGKLAVELAARGGTQAELAAQCADPTYDISRLQRAYEVRNLLAEGVKA
jgi:tetratricopeptide (TPR) repeat protein